MSVWAVRNSWLEEDDCLLDLLYFSLLGKKAFHSELGVRVLGGFIEDVLSDGDVHILQLDKPREIPIETSWRRLIGRAGSRNEKLRGAVRSRR